MDSAAFLVRAACLVCWTSIAQVLPAQEAAGVLPDDARLVTVGPIVTETVFALGAGERVVAVDDRSDHPAAGMAGLPRVGYLRSLAAEGLLSLRPTAVLADADAGPDAVLARVREAGVDVRRLDGGRGVEGAKLGIRTLAAWLGRNEAGEALVDAMDRDLREAAAIVARTDRRPRVLCAYARDPRSLHVAGAATTPDALLAAAGARNAVPEFEGFRPLDAEAAVAAAPDVVLVSRRTLELLGGERELLAHPGLALTPAAQAGVAAVVVLDEQELFGAGPRTGAAVLALVRRLHPEATRDHEAEAVRDAPAADEDRP